MRSTCPYLLGALLIATLSLGGGLDGIDRSTLSAFAVLVESLPAPLYAGPADAAPVEVGSRLLAPIAALFCVALGLLFQRLAWWTGLLALACFGTAVLAGAVLCSVGTGFALAPGALLAAGLLAYAIARLGGSDLGGAAGPASGGDPAGDSLMPKLVRASAAAILTFDGEGIIRSCNPAAAVMFGYPSSELLGMRFARLLEVEGEDQPRLLRGRDGEARELTGRRLNGQRFPVQASFSTFHLAGDAMGIAVLHDISRIKVERELLQLHDDVTGLYNRTVFYDRVDQAILAAERTHRPLAVFVIHLNLFKTIRETMGEGFGDDLIRQTSARLQGLLRRSDTLARMGGCELAALLPDLNPADHAITKAQWIAQAMPAPFSVEGVKTIIDVSIGVAVYPQHGRDRHRLAQAAENAMLNARRSQQGVMIAGQADEAPPSREIGLRDDLREAIEQDRLTLDFQPKLDLGSGRLAGFEGLVRWHDPDHGNLPAERVLPVAEQSGLMLPLTLRVLAMSLAQQHAWRAEGWQIPVSVNVSASCVRNPEFALVVRQVLKTWDGDARQLAFEISEDALAKDPAVVQQTLEQIAALGCGLALDDFGTSSFSLSSLRKLPVQALKIDRCFVAAMLQDDDAATIVRSAISLGKSLGLRVVAEGVEDQRTLDELRGIGCAEAQGFLIGAPMPPAAVAEWLRRNADAPAPQTVDA
ncbi:MAG TPA: EAL domain-containing protein [Geminicoccaceae bacterium]|nr:EAL domain-containing protein [Geminicoccaceae bacterium]